MTLMSQKYLKDIMGHVARPFLIRNSPKDQNMVFRDNNVRQHRTRIIEKKNYFFSIFIQIDGYFVGRLQPMPKTDIR